MKQTVALTWVIVIAIATFLLGWFAGKQGLFGAKTASVNGTNGATTTNGGVTTDTNGGPARMY